MSKVKGKVKTSVKLRVVNLSEGDVVELQQFFLDKFLLIQKFGLACCAVKNHRIFAGVTPEGITGLNAEALAQSVVGQWAMEDEEFKIEFDKAKKIVEFVAAERVEEFLIKMGTGEQKTRKEDGYSTANPISGHMFLEAVDHQKWSSKAQKAVKKNDVIPRIEFHDHPGRPKKENDTD
jgi:hypothetical protein